MSERGKLLGFIAWTSVANSAVLPNVAFRVIEMHAAPTVTAAYFLLGSAGTLLSLLAVERLTTRIPIHVVAFIGLAWTAVGYLLLPLATAPLAFVLLGAMLSLGIALPLSQYFTILGRLVTAGRAPAGAVSRARAVYAGVYILGASAGGVIGAAIGARPVFLVIGIGSIAATVLWAPRLRLTEPAGDQRTPDRPDSGAAQPPATAHRRAWRLVNLFLAGLALVSAGGQFRSSLMPAYYLTDAHVPAPLIGWALGAAPIAEVPLLWAMPRIVSRIGSRTTMTLGAVCGVVFFAVVLVTRDPVTALTSQLLFGVFAACALALALEIAQSAVPGRDTVTTRFFAWASLSSLLGGVATTTTSALLPLHQVFLTPLLAAVAGLLLIVIALRQLRGARPSSTATARSEPTR